jgi:hypothetical protein
MESRAAPKLDRLDRHVARSRVRISGRDSRHRVACSLGEALRLVNLPGEEEGRIYCFRSVSLSGIPAQANHKIWTDRVQQVLGVLATQAVHGTDPQAGSANAVYFHHHQEALETLLRSALQSEARPEWFSASILGLAPEPSHALRILAILERLRQPSIPPGAAAAIILAAIGTSDPALLLAAIPLFTIRDWIREIDGQKNLFTHAAPIQLPGQIRTALQQAADHFGWRDPRTTWLAALAVISLAPATLAAGTAVKRARLILRRLEALEPPGRAAIPGRNSFRSPGNTSRVPIFDDEDAAGRWTSSLVQRSGLLEDSPPGSASLKNLTGDPSLPGEPRLIPDSDIIAGGTLSPCHLADPSPLESVLVDPALATSELKGVTASSALLGEPTQAAGLYFLLNVLRRLRVPAVLEACPALTETGFVAHLLKRIAVHAKVVRGDPILLCLHPEETEFSLSPEVLAMLRSHTNAKIWPAYFPPPHRADFKSDYFLRIWALAVRRWCWRMGKMTVREIVGRNGLVWLTRTDLDVTLPLAATDIRIRRIGLDIDPGWLPWFGEFGRVVRFHYRDREPGGSVC